MHKLNRDNYIFIAALAAIMVILSVSNSNLLLNIMFLVCIFLGFCTVKPKDNYERLYYTLIISAFFEYTVYFLRYEKLYLFHILLVLLTINYLYLLFKKKYTLQKIDKKILSFYIIWYLYIVVSIIWSKNTSYAIKYIIIYTIMFLFLFILIQFNSSREKFYNTLKVMGIMFVIVICIGLLESIIGIQLPVKHYYNYTVHQLSLRELSLVSKRPIAFFYNSNNFATVVTIFLSFSMFFTFYCKRRMHKILAYIVTIIAFSTIILTNSRTNFLSAVVVTIIFSILILLDDRKKSLIYIVLFLISFTISYNYSYLLVSNRDVSNQPQISKRMNELSNIYKNKVELGEEGSVNERMTIINDVYEGVIKEGRIFGFGAGNTPQYLMDRKNTAGIYSPHGLLIELLGDFGLPFLILFICYTLYLLYSTFKTSVTKSGISKSIGYSLMTSIIGYGIASFAPSSVTYFLPNWIFIGLVISYIQINKTIGKGKEYEF